MKFSFATAGRVIFGPGTAQELPKLASGYGERVFLVLDAHIDPESDPVRRLGGQFRIWSAAGEPTVAGIEEAVAAARAFQPDVVVALGGGSIIDTAKAIGVLLRNSGGPLDYLEVIGEGRQLTPESVPVVAMPTTAGTGAEVTANTPIYSPEHRVKASLRSPAMLPTLAVVDPELTISCPPSVTAAAGLDALTQCLEPVTSSMANSFTDILAREGLARAAAGLRRAYQDGGDLTARTQMSMCSLLGGMALANAKLGAVHGLAAPLGGMIGAAHGELCASVLAACTEANVAALRERDPNSIALSRYDEAAKILTGRASASVADGVAWIRETVALLGARSLGQLGLTSDQIPDAVAQAQAASSMQGNPIPLTDEELTRVVQQSI